SQVAVVIGVPAAYVLQRVDSVEVLGAGHHRYPLVPERVVGKDVVRVVVVEHRSGGDEVDSTSRVDHPDQAKQSNPDVVVDMDVEVALHRGDRRAGSAS